MVLFASGYPSIYISTLGSIKLNNYINQEDGAYLLAENGNMLEIE